MKAAVFASGTGTNFDALLEAQKAGRLDVELCAVVCDKEGAPVRDKARAAGLPERWVNPRAYASKADYESEILNWMRELDIDLIILSGYMRIVGPTLLNAYPDRIVNLHPALLPQFPGAHAILDAWKAGVRETGVTVHYIDDQIDSGPVIVQEPVAVEPDWSLEELETAVHAKEYDLFYRGINMAAAQIAARALSENEKEPENGK